MKGPALAVMARAPAPGQTKTRLQPELTPEQSTELSLAFLKDAITLAAELPVYSTFLAYTPGNALDFFHEMVPERLQLIPQVTGDIGVRMNRIISALEGRGFSPVIVIGTDIPLLQPDTLLQALETLKQVEICFGPSSDGGYYLVGMNRTDARVFQDIVWSTKNVLDQTLRRVKGAGLSFALLDTYSDVDTFDDLRNLNTSLERLRRIPGARLPRQTEEWLSHNKSIFI